MNETHSKQSIPRWGITLFLLSELILIAPATRIFAQPSSPLFDRITADQGLPSSVVNSIIQDQFGFMWFATMEGLCRYDGYDMKVFQNDPGDSTSLSDKTAWSVFEDSKGWLWVATFKGGLNRFDRVTERFTRFVSKEHDSTTIPSNSVLSLYEDSRGTFWVGTYGGGLCILDRVTGLVTRMQLDKGRPLSPRDAYIRSIFEYPDGKLWIGTAQALFKLDLTTRQIETYSHLESDKNSITAGSVGPITPDGHGNVWIGTTGGLNRMNPATGEVTRFVHSRLKNSLVHDRVFALRFDNHGLLWIGTLGGGISIFYPRTETFTSLKSESDNEHTLSDDDVRTLFLDRAGAFWVGTTNGGVCKLNIEQKQFKFIPNKPGNQFLLSGGIVQAVLEDRRGNLWVGSQSGGLFRRATGNQQFTHLPGNDEQAGGISHRYVTKIIEDYQGIIWIGTYGGGLNSLDPLSGTNKLFQPSPDDPTGLTSYDISDLYEDHEHVLWVGTEASGLFRYNRRTESFTHFRRQQNDSTSLRNDRVRVIIEDHSGLLWIGTEGDGISVLNESRTSFHHFSNDPNDQTTISNNLVYSLHQDASGTLWIGTASGLNKFNPETKSFARYFNEAEHASNYILAITSDSRGSLWLNTASGLVRFNTGTGEFRTYNAADGLQGNEFSNASFQTKNGEIIVGGKNGLNIFLPDSIEDNQHPPAIVLTDFKVFEKPFPLDSSVTTKKVINLSHDQNFISFAYAALDYSNPVDNLYAYTMEGFDNQWIEVGTRRYATYTNLNPGSYVFRVKASNSDGVWNDTGTAISLVVRPPYWQTWWFRILVVLVAVGIIALLYNRRIAQLLAIERMRVRIASDLHDDIGSSLGSIALLSDMVRTKSTLGETESQQLREISKSARHTAEALRDIVWVINPEHDKIDNLVLRMRDAANSMIRSDKVNFYCQSAKMAHVVDMDFRRNILLIYKEILHNIIKHARAKTIDISIDETDSQFHLTIRDDGVGFDPSQPGPGHGMKTLTTRAGRLGGSVHIESARGKGTTVVVTAKIP